MKAIIRRYVLNQAIRDHTQVAENLKRVLMHEYDVIGSADIERQYDAEKRCIRRIEALK